MPKDETLGIAWRRLHSAGLGSLTDIRQQRHEAGALDRVLHGPLESRAIAAPLAAELLALARAHLLEALNVLIVHECRTRAAFLRAETAAVLTAFLRLLADHS